MPRCWSSTCPVGPSRLTWAMLHRDGGIHVYTLYYSPGSASLVVHLALLEIGAPFRLEKVDFDRDAQHSPEYLRINPRGQVPTLVIDGQPYFESAALLMILAERHPEARLAPPPGSDAARGLVPVDRVLHERAGARVPPVVLSAGSRLGRASAASAGRAAREDRRVPGRSSTRTCRRTAPICWARAFPAWTCSRPCTCAGRATCRGRHSNGRRSSDWPTSCGPGRVGDGCARSRG